METKYYSRLSHYLHAINLMGEDKDVWVDGIESIAVCPPVKLTQVGQKEFEKALNATVVFTYEDGSHQDTYIGDDEEDVIEEAWRLLVSLAGYCPSSKYKDWFEGDDAEII